MASICLAGAILQAIYPPVKYPVEEGLSLIGRVVRPNQKMAGKVQLTFLVAKADSTRDMMAGESDSEGRFGIYGLHFLDSATFFIQAIAGKNNRNVEIQLEDMISPTVTLAEVPYNPIVFQKGELAEYLKRTREYLRIVRQIQRNREVLLNEVTVRTKRGAG